MNIVLSDGEVMKDKHPVTMCTGYKAKSIIMEKGDFKSLHNLLHSNPNQLGAVLLQLENRFK